MSSLSLRIIDGPHVVPDSAVTVFERGELGFLLPLQARFRTAGEERPAGRAGMGCAQPVAGTRCGRDEGVRAAPQRRAVEEGVVEAGAGQDFQVAVAQAVVG